MINKEGDFGFAHNILFNYIVRCEEEFGTEEELDKHVNDKHNTVNITSLPFSTLKATGKT